MMNFDLLFNTAIANLISGLVTNIVWIALVIWGVRYLARIINKGFDNLIKNIPHWIEQYEKTKLKVKTVDRALEGRK